jgi:hypothetical protein
MFMSKLWYIPKYSIKFFNFPWEKNKIIELFFWGENLNNISENNIIFSVQLVQVLRVDGRKWTGWGFHHPYRWHSLSSFSSRRLCESTPSSLVLHQACLLAGPPPAPAPFFSSPQIRWMLFVVCCSLVVVIFMHTPNRFFCVENPAFF